jgi:general secretion pathway protein J
MNETRSARGFTLIELLVSMALLSLVMLGLLTALRSFAQTETRIDERIRQGEDLRVSEPFLRAIVGTISPRNRAVAAGAPRQIDFSGAAGGMQWIGVMPARHGAGGLYRFHLYQRLAAADGPAALVLEFAPYVAGFDGPLDPSSVQSRVMAGPVGAVSFRYQDDLRSGRQWLSDWPYTDRLPRRVSLSVLGASQPWPEIIVPVVPVVGPGAVGRGGGVVSGVTVGPF